MTTRSSRGVQGQALQRLIMLVGLISFCTCCVPSSELVACLPAVEADVQPSPQCCFVLTRYLSTDKEACLCQVASSYAFDHASPAVVQFAASIPQKCNLSYRAGTQCNGVIIPGGQ